MFDSIKNQVMNFPLLRTFLQNLEGISLFSNYLLKMRWHKDIYLFKIKKAGAVNLPVRQRERKRVVKSAPSWVWPRCNLPLHPPAGRDSGHRLGCSPCLRAARVRV